MVYNILVHHCLNCPQLFEFDFVPPFEVDLSPPIKVVIVPPLEVDNVFSKEVDIVPIWMSRL